MTGKGTGACAVGIFARAPEPGKTKTRLIPAVGPEGAARVHVQLVQRAVQAALAAGLGPVVLWTQGDAGHPAFRALPTAVQRRPQPEGDLGARMHHALGRMLRLAPRALLIGSDCAVMDAALLRRAAQRLADAPMVYTPAEDGGYVLVGTRLDLALPFQDMPWGTDEVMDRTRACLQAAGVPWAETDPSWDIDRPEDLARAQALGLLVLD